MKILKLLGLAALIGGATAIAVYKIRENKIHKCECGCDCDCTEDCTCGCECTKPENYEELAEIKHIEECKQTEDCTCGCPCHEETK